MDALVRIVSVPIYEEQSHRIMKLKYQTIILDRNISWTAQTLLSECLNTCKQTKTAKHTQNDIATYKL